MKDSCVCFKDGRKKIGNEDSLRAVASWLFLGPPVAYPIEDGLVVFRMNENKDNQRARGRTSQRQFITSECAVAIIVKADRLASYDAVPSPISHSRR
jgi:hypothetical protein